MERTVLHVDCNKFYASVECLHRPELRDKPVAVGGSTESRHGIILTKNEIASRYGLVAGEPLWQARQKCRSWWWYRRTSRCICAFPRWHGGSMRITATILSLSGWTRTGWM